MAPVKQTTQPDWRTRMQAVISEISNIKSSKERTRVQKNLFPSIYGVPRPNEVGNIPNEISDLYSDALNSVPGDTPKKQIDKAMLFAIRQQPGLNQISRSALIKYFTASDQTMTQDESAWLTQQFSSDAYALQVLDYYKALIDANKETIDKYNTDSPYFFVVDPSAMENSLSQASVLQEPVQLNVPAVPESQAVPVPQAVPVTRSAPMPQAVPVTRSAPMPQAVPVTQSAPTPQAVPVTRSAPMPQAVPVTQSAPMPQAVPVTQSAPMPQAVPVTQSAVVPPVDPMKLSWDDVQNNLEKVSRNSYMEDLLASSTKEDAQKFSNAQNFVVTNVAPSDPKEAASMFEYMQSDNPLWLAFVENKWGDPYRFYVPKVEERKNENLEQVKEDAGLEMERKQAVLEMEQKKAQEEREAAILTEARAMSSEQNFPAEIQDAMNAVNAWSESGRPTRSLVNWPPQEQMYGDTLGLPQTTMAKGTIIPKSNIVSGVPMEQMYGDNVSFPQTTFFALPDANLSPEERLSLMYKGTIIPKSNIVSGVPMEQMYGDNVSFPKIQEPNNPYWQNYQNGANPVNKPFNLSSEISQNEMYEWPSRPMQINLSSQIPQDQMYDLALPKIQEPDSAYWQDYQNRANPVNKPFNLSSEISQNEMYEWPSRQKQINISSQIPQDQMYDLALPKIQEPDSGYWPDYQNRANVPVVKNVYRPVFRDPQEYNVQDLNAGYWASHQNKSNDSSVNNVAPQKTVYANKEQNYKNIQETNNGYWEKPNNEPFVLVPEPTRSAEPDSGYWFSYLKDPVSNTVPNNYRRRPSKWGGY